MNNITHHDDLTTLGPDLDPGCEPDRPKASATSAIVAQANLNDAVLRLVMSVITEDAFRCVAPKEWLGVGGTLRRMVDLGNGLPSSPCLRGNGEEACRLLLEVCEAHEALERAEEDDNDA